MNIREYLKKSKLVADGSFGTYYSTKYKTDDIPEYSNITNPQRIFDIHTEYINSGARLIRTNTFASNTYSLDCSLEKVKENIRAAFEIAKKRLIKAEKKYLSQAISGLYLLCFSRILRLSRRNTIR